MNIAERNRIAGKKIAKIFALLSVGAISIVGVLALGMRSALREDRLFQLAKEVKRIALPKNATAKKAAAGVVQFNEFGQLTQYPNKEVMIKPTTTRKTIIAFVFGQSNAANHAGEKFFSNNTHIFNYWNEQYYVASDPLLGSTGSAGSVWTLTANKLIKEKTADAVILVPAAVAGTSVADWRPGGRLNEMFENRLKSALKNNLAITHFFWHQGEADNPIGGHSRLELADYEVGMKKIIAQTKKYFPQSKFFVAIATRCDYSRPVSIPLQNIQRSLAKMNGVFVGPNTDNIGLEDRYDDCHFSGNGLEKHSNSWLSAINQSQRWTRKTGQGYK